MDTVRSKAKDQKSLLTLFGWQGIVFIIGVLLVWHFISVTGNAADRYLFPALPDIAKALIGSLPELLAGTVSSLSVLIPAYMLASATAIVLGLLVGTIPWLSKAFMPFAKIVAPVPTTVYIPYAIAIMPAFNLASGFVIFIGTFWPVFLNTTIGASTLQQTYRDNARILGLGRIQFLTKVVFRSALSNIFSGMAVGLAFAFILLTVSELFGVNAGLGRFVQLYADYADYPKMIAGIIYTGLIALFSLEILELARKRATFWMK